MDHQLVDGHGRGHSAKVNRAGAVAVGAPEYSAFYEVFLGTTAVQNVLRPVPGKSIVITYVVMSTNKNVALDGAQVDLYEAGGPAVASTAATRVLFRSEIPKQTTVPFPGLNLLVSDGAFVNAQTSDDDVYVAVGFYLAKEDDAGAENARAKGADAL